MSDLHDKIRDRLPPVLEDIADVAGVEAALSMVFQGGGRRLRIPRRVEGSRLEKWVGQKAASAIAQNMCYMYFEIPQAKSACALWMKSQGQSVEDIAFALKATRRSVQNWLHDY